MNSNLSKVFIFALGAIAGSLATFKYAEKKYAAIAQEEIDSVKATFKKSGGSLIKHEGVKEDESVQSDETKDIHKIVVEAGKRITQGIDDTMNDYKDVVKKNEYFTHDSDEPRVISPDEFGEDEDYTQISLMLYADGVLVDDNNEVMGEDEIRRTIGPYALDHLGDYEEDCVHICNDRLKAYYEVLTDVRKWSDVLENRPYLRR